MAKTKKSAAAKAAGVSTTTSTPAVGTTAPGSLPMPGAPTGSSSAATPVAPAATITPAAPEVAASTTIPPATAARPARRTTRRRAATPPTITPATPIRNWIRSHGWSVLGGLVLLGLILGTIYYLFTRNKGDSIVPTGPDVTSTDKVIVDRDNQIVVRQQTNVIQIPNISVPGSGNVVIVGNNNHHNGIGGTSTNCCAHQKVAPAVPAPAPVWPEGFMPSKTEKILDCCESKMDSEKIEKIVVPKILTARADVVYLIPKGWKVDPSVHAAWSEYQVVYNIGTLASPKWVPATGQSMHGVVAFWFRSLKDLPIKIQFDCVPLS